MYGSNHLKMDWWPNAIMHHTLKHGAKHTVWTGVHSAQQKSARIRKPPKKIATHGSCVRPCSCVDAPGVDCGSLLPQRIAACRESWREKGLFSQGPMQKWPMKETQNRTRNITYDHRQSSEPLCLSLLCAWSNIGMSLARLVYCVAHPFRYSILNVLCFHHVSPT